MRRHLLKIFIFALLIFAAVPVFAEELSSPSCTQQQLFELFNASTHSEQKRMAKQLGEDLKNARTHYTLAESAGGESEVLKLYESWHQNKNLLEVMNHWIRTPDQANFAVSFLKNFPNEGEKVLSDLIKNNPFFKDVAAYIHPDGKVDLVTYGFEKEGNSENITFYYKTKGFSDEEWFKLPEAERLNILKNEVGSLRRRQNSSLKFIQSALFLIIHLRSRDFIIMRPTLLRGFRQKNESC